MTTQPLQLSTPVWRAPATGQHDSLDTAVTLLDLEIDPRTLATPTVLTWLDQITLTRQAPDPTP